MTSLRLNHVLSVEYQIRLELYQDGMKEIMLFSLSLHFFDSYLCNLGAFHALTHEDAFLFKLFFVDIAYTNK